jgi:antitoxin component YwqK of YwqJK toxin-antitoxin module
MMKNISKIALLLVLCANIALAKTYIVEDNTQKSSYVDGKRQGMTWWYNEKNKVKSKVNFDNDQENGLYTSYYDNGKIKLTVHYVQGQKDGVQKIYYDNGQLGSEVSYDMGRREGLMVEWDFEGFKSSEVLYKRNYKVGLKKYYDHNGKVTMTKEFKMDRNPLMVKLLKDKQKETLIDLAKYGLMPKDASKEERMR